MPYGMIVKKFLLREPTKFLNRFRKQPPVNRLQSKSTRAILMPYGMIVEIFCSQCGGSACRSFRGNSYEHRTRDSCCAPMPVCYWASLGLGIADLCRVLTRSH